MKKFLAISFVLLMAFSGISFAASTAENKATSSDFNSDVPTVSIYGHSGANAIVPIKVSSDGTVATSGSGGGAVTIADAANVALGAKADAKSTATDTTPVTAMQVLKQISYMEQNPASRVVTNSVTSAALITKTVDFSASETAQAIWTPTSGKKFVITDMVISCSAAGTITVFDSTDTTATRIVKGYFAANGGLSQPYSKPRESSTANNVLKYTTGSGIAGSITVQGYEI